MKQLLLYHVAIVDGIKLFHNVYNTNTAAYAQTILEINIHEATRLFTFAYCCTTY